MLRFCYPTGNKARHASSSRTLGGPRRRAMKAAAGAVVQNLESRMLLSAAALDPTFGTAGTLVATLPGYDQLVTHDAALQSDGKLVVVGKAHNASGATGWDFLVARFTADGALDSSFGSGGWVVTDMGTGEDEAWAVAIQGDGKIVVGGAGDPTPGYWGLPPKSALARYDTDGDLDSSFGTGGKITSSHGDGIRDLALQANGRIVAVETDKAADGLKAFVISRYTPEGQLDGGSFAFPYGAQYVYFAADSPTVPSVVKVLETGFVLAAGSAYSPGPVQQTAFAVVRVGPNGFTSDDFNGGYFTTRVGTFAEGADLVIQPDGSFIVGGPVSTRSDCAITNYGMVRYLASGQLDPSFGSGGKVITGYPTSTSGFSDSALVQQADGKLLVAGWDPANAPGDHKRFVIARYTDRGALDTSFAPGGKVITDLSGYDHEIASLVLRPDGRLIAIGAAQIDADGRTGLALAQYGIPYAARAEAGDITRAATGFYRFTVTYSADAGIGVTSIGDGDILVTGPNGFSQLARLSALDYAPDGSPRATYRITPPGGGWDSADDGLYVLALQGSQVADTTGKALAGGVVGSFHVGVPIPDTITPEVCLGGPGTTECNGGEVGCEVSLSCTDNVAIDVSSLDDNDILVTSPDGSQQWARLARVNPMIYAGNGTSIRRISYTITPPGGTWDLSDYGTYTIALQPQQVRDTSGNYAPATAITWMPWTLAPDTTAPVLSIWAPDMKTANGAYRFSLGYSDNREMDPAMLGTEEVLVTGPNGYRQLARFVAPGPREVLAQCSATYEITKPDDTDWDTADNGRYTITVISSQVRDLQGNIVANATGFTRNFRIAIPGPDTTAPTATLDAQDLREGRAWAYQCWVLVTDNVAIDCATVGGTQVVVTGPHGFRQVFTWAISPSEVAEPRCSLSLYLNSPDGRWDTGENGTYTVSLESCAITDTSGHPLQANVVGTFQVDIDNGVPPLFDGSSFSDMAFDSSGRLHCAYYSWYMGLTRRCLMYAMRSADGIWGPTITIDADSPDVGQYISLAIDQDNNPGISYYDAWNGDLRYAHFNGTSWNVQTVDSYRTTGLYTSLGYDTRNRPVISYYYSKSGDLRLAAWNGASWEIRTIDSIDDSGRFSSLALSPTDGQLAIAYENSTDGEYRYAQQARRSWDVQTVDDTAIGGGYISLTFDSEGRPAFSYYDAWGADLKLAQFDGSAWQTQTVAARGSQGMYSNLYFDGQDRINILYFNKSANGVFYAQYTSGNWACQQIVASGGRGLQVALSPDGTRAVAWIDATADRLRVGNV